MTAAHMDAVLQLLEEFPHTLYVGQVPDQPSFPYAVIYMDTGRGGDLRLSGHTRRRTYDFQITSVGLTDVLDMYVGQSEHNLKDIFEEARANTPAVLFFDELDALGGSRTDRKNSASRELINAFLQELDGVSGSNDGILFLGATNTPWYIDTAFKRPGRFGQAIFVAPPDVVAREEILSIHLKGKPVEEHLDLRKVAEKTEYFTGADLKSLVDLAIQDKLKEIMKTGRREPVTTKDLLKKCAEIHPSSNEWFETAKNYAIYSNQHGQYDEILKYLKIKK